MQFSIYRYDPEIDNQPYMQDYTLVIKEGHDMMLLEALEQLKEEDQTLTFRRSCREGVCGSDGMNVNGKNTLACITPLSSLRSPIVLRPLPGFPVIRDLVVDMESFYHQYEKARPYLMNAKEPPVKERLQSPEQREKLDGLYECILCACCTSACPSYWWNPDKFLGPAALLWLCRFLVDNRDDAKDQRLAELNDLFRLFRCRTIMNCTSVCPKGLNPAKAIGHVRSVLLQKEV
ncbi:succinate dehydrogenase iron-sulfur subunit [Rickettsiella grylli]|uniref:Succinate dehydrogenase iron-sulfur subunit n=2 Tax=Rickettsiella grylli TaxID=59196 RepID=A8PMS4_9COXI|nr:succinate dehydrogenase iron-sulfur subunit [Rickettsiella grylli]EDP46648.1 succinate dehydrogenase iron-sulfur subunit [Rickettsiella grylli]OIZ98158.1 succinate dehydrogenase iron-sulfur subunit [Rickettsiella grylli]